jgi:moderate conductance mechanosensitive channel
MLFAQTTTDLDKVSQNLKESTDQLLNLQSIGLFVTLLALSFLIGKVLAALLRQLDLLFSRQADKSNHLPTVNRWRRAETIIVLSIAVIRVALFALAIYLWWIIIHPTQQPTAIIGASAIFAVLAGGILGPLLRDFASGSVMMTERWFGVGDHIKIEPFADMQGVVEQVTLRSTRIRGLNGEIIRVNNQNIQAVRVTPKGIRTIAIELFVNHLEEGKKLIEETAQRLPAGPLLVIKSLNIMSASEVGDNLWHITAIGQTAPGREWLIEKYAVEVMQELDTSAKKSILRTEPIARNADSVAEQKFARAIRNARKVSTKPTIAAQLQEVATSERARSKKLRFRRIE